MSLTLKTDQYYNVFDLTRLLYKTLEKPIVYCNRGDHFFESYVQKFENNQDLQNFIKETCSSQIYDYIVKEDHVKMVNRKFYEYYDIFGDITDLLKDYSVIVKESNHGKHPKNKDVRECIYVTYDFDFLKEKTDLHSILEQLYLQHKEYPIDLISANNEIEFGIHKNIRGGMTMFTYTMTHSGTVGKIFMVDDYAGAVLEYGSSKFYFHVFGLYEYLKAHVVFQGEKYISHKQWFKLMGQLNELPDSVVTIKHHKCLIL